MFVTNWISPTKIQKISEITNFFRHYFLSRTEVFIQLIIKGREIRCMRHLLLPLTEIVAKSNRNLRSASLNVRSATLNVCSATLNVRSTTLNGDLY